MGDTRSLSATVGSNIERLRTEGGATRDEVARLARGFGLKWTVPRVTELENGGQPITVEKLIVLAAVMAEILDRPITLADLVRSDVPVRITPIMTLASGAPLARVLEGGSLPFEGAEIGMPPVAEMMGNFLQGMDEVSKIRGAKITVGEYWDVTTTWGIADERAKKSLGIDTSELLAHASALWGRSVTAERDARAGEGAGAQKRGQVTRDLLNELRESISKADSHGDN